MEMIKETWKRRLIFFLSLCVLTFSLGSPLAIAEDGAAADPSAAIPPPEPACFQFNLIQGWNMISLPFATDPSPLVVFAELPKPWYLVEYDPVEQRYIPYAQIALKPGVGYWLYSSQAIRFIVTGIPLAVLSVHPLSLGWNLVGYPFLREVSVQDALKVRVNRGGQSYSLEEAFQTGILSAGVYTFWGGERYLSVKDDIGRFQPGLAYWVKVNALPAAAGESLAAVPLTEIVFNGLGIEGSKIASWALKKAAKALLEKAGDWQAEKGNGWLLSLLGGSKGSSKEVLDRLNEMGQQLTEIQASLARIEQDFGQLFKQMGHMEAKLIDTILNAQIKDYVNRIDTHYNANSPDGLYYFTNGKTPTTPNIAADTLNFYNNVKGSWDILNCVNGIHKGIVPSDGSYGILDTWVDSNVLTQTTTWTFQPQRLMDYYLGFEDYFAGLLFYEYRGVQVYTEALNYGDPSGVTSANWLTVGPESYQNWLNGDVNRFLVCVGRMVAHAANLGATDPNDPLFKAGAEVLARAQFFALQTLNQEHYGMRGAILATTDALINTNMAVISNSGKGVSTSTKATVIAIPNGPAYDRWQDNASFLGQSTDWALLLADWGELDPSLIGTGYRVRLSTPAGLPFFPLSPLFSYDRYDDSYSPTITGTVYYGCGFGWARVGGAQQFGAVDPAVGSGLNPQWTLDVNNIVFSQAGDPQGKKGLQWTKNDGIGDLSLSPGVQFTVDAQWYHKNTYSCGVQGAIQDLRHFTCPSIISSDPFLTTLRATYQVDCNIGSMTDCLNFRFNLDTWVRVWDYNTKNWVNTNWRWFGTAVQGHSPKWNVQYGTNGVVTQSLALTLIPGHQYGLCIGLNTDCYLKADNGGQYPAPQGTTVRNMRASITLKGATFSFP